VSYRGTGWLSVKHLTLDFGLGHDLSVMGSNPASGSVLRGNMLEILSLPLLLPLPPTHALN